MMFEIRSPETAIEWEMYYDLRYRVLREPLGKPKGSERNEGDDTGIQFALFEKKSILAVARLDQLNAVEFQIRFVAVERNQQGKGLGNLIMAEVESKAIELGSSKIILHARDYACPFYEKRGYINKGASYKLFDTLQHFEFHKNT
jgi:predicted GNAT family N-acyltransferase